MQGREGGEGGRPIRGFQALRLYRNFIDDVAVCRLSQMLAEQSEAIEELHLSNNRITGRSVLERAVAEQCVCFQNEGLCSC